MTLSITRKLLAFASLVLTLSLLGELAPAQELAAKRKPDLLGGPPLVTAKAWAIVEADTGKFLWGANENTSLPMASTTKIMTAWLTLNLQGEHPDILDGTMTISAEAAKTIGSSAKIQTGDTYPVRELLYGLLLPSGNDAATAFAEHCGERYRVDGDAEGAQGAFVAQMNRQAAKWDLKQTQYVDPHGLGKNQTSAADLAQMARHIMQNEVIRKIVGTRRHEYEVTGADQAKRTSVWNNTNRLLEIEGFEGMKTGTTTPAGSCLVSSGRRGKDHLIVVVLGSTSNDGRYVDARNLYRWAWRERGHKDD
ncbi:D-alanyl-D-alanine carboxypeptidase family protein [Anatilimnocola sp. NA78]|uniref:D-alanyl-D-alanine carboxypeptidase family protein n=1 Tax=Anatilimnocola sp. NA78 TaxID=3415683 RepID=UPI003CE4D1BD